MRCLVTGVAGFIGSHLAERLVNDGHEVCGIDSFTPFYPRSVKEMNVEGLRSSNRFTLVEGDLLDLHLEALIDGVDWIFHQAAQAGVRTSWGSDFALYIDNNILSTQRLLDAALQGDRLSRFIYASSSSVYGEMMALPLCESSSLNPVSPYGVTKLAGEHLCSLYHDNFALPTVSLRYFTVYGPRQRPDMAFHRFCKALLTGETIRIYGDGQQTRDFTFVSDVIDANVLAAWSPAAVGETLNIAGGTCVSICEVIQLLREISGLSANLAFEQKQYGDVSHTYASTYRAEEVLGYLPVVSLLDGLVQEFQYVASLYAGKGSSTL